MTHRVLLNNENIILRYSKNYGYWEGHMELSVFTPNVVSYNKMEFIIKNNEIIPYRYFSPNAAGTNHYFYSDMDKKVFWSIIGGFMNKTLQLIKDFEELKDLKKLPNYEITKSISKHKSQKMHIRFPNYVGELVVTLEDNTLYMIWQTEYESSLIQTDEVQNKWGKKKLENLYKELATEFSLPDLLELKINKKPLNFRKERTPNKERRRY